MKHILFILLVLMAGCTQEEPPLPNIPAAVAEVPVVQPDTSTLVVIAGSAYGKPFIMLWRDLNTGWVDTFYQGYLFHKDTLWIPRMEWGELRIETPGPADSVYLRKGCTQGFATGAIGFIISNP